MSAAENGGEDRVYYRIGEASRLLGVPPHTLRYWEQEFPALAPRRDARGRRRYTPADLERIRHLRKLVHEDGYRVRAAKRLVRRPAAAGAKKTLDKARLRRQLEKINRLLERAAGE